MLGYDATATLRTINVPTMVISGDRDGSCVPQASERIHQDVPASQLVPLAPAKHMGLIEHNQRFADLVRAFSVDCFQGARPHQPIERTV
jgi:pimeloyl-ACP methyl ester carboxylesterase